MVDSIVGKKMNKGEWAELYVMLKLLGEGKLYAADNMLKKKLDTYLDVLKIIRQEFETQVLEYIVDQEKSLVTVKPQDSDTVLTTIPMCEFEKNAVTLFDGLKKARGMSVTAPDSVCEFAKIIYVSKPKAPAVKALKRQFGGKNDIFIEVRDGQTAIVSVMGFSIKSKFGQNPTLFNAGSSSQYLFKLHGCNEAKMNEFNMISDGKGGRGWGLCKAYLASHFIKAEFAMTQYPVYNDNLLLVRESMPKIMAWCVCDRLLGDNTKHGVKETTERMAAENPLAVGNSEIYYEKAIKDFLMAGFTGMTAGSKWNGKEQVNGGYIVVTDEGDVICYHSNDRESFRDYLYRNTYFEYVSADKYNWSRIIKIGGEYYLPLNISVRFTSYTR